MIAAQLDQGIGNPTDDLNCDDLLCPAFLGPRCGAEDLGLLAPGHAAVRHRHDGGQGRRDGELR